MSFNSGNFSNAGIRYDYDALNALLDEYLDGIHPDSFDYHQVEAKASDSINDSLIERDGKIWSGDTVVGVVIDDE